MWKWFRWVDKVGMFDEDDLVFFSVAVRGRGVLGKEMVAQFRAEVAETTCDDNGGG